MEIDDALTTSATEVVVVTAPAPEIVAFAMVARAAVGIRRRCYGGTRHRRGPVGAVENASAARGPCV